MSRIPADDRLEIQEFGARYAFRCDTKAYDEVSELFTEDGWWDETIIGLPRCEGRQAIHDFFTSMAQADLEFIIHINANHQLTAYDGEGASATTHFHASGRFNGSDVRIFGYYADTYAKVAGRWLITSRKLEEITPSTGFGG